MTTYLGSTEHDFIIGQLTTADQPNITSLGTLTELNVNGNISGNSLAGTLTTSNQPNITSLGTLTELNVNGNNSLSGDLNSNSNIFGKFYGFICYFKSSVANRIYSYVSPYGETGAAATYYGYLGVNNHFIDRTGGIDKDNMTFTSPKRGFWQFNVVGHGGETTAAGRHIIVINTIPALTDPLLPEATTYEISDYSTLASGSSDNMTLFAGIVQMAVGDKIQFKGHTNTTYKMYKYVYFTGSYLGV